LIETGVPASKQFHFSRLLGAFSGETIHCHIALSGSFAGSRAPAFVAQVPDVAVARVNIRFALLDGYVVRLRVDMASSRELMVHSRHGAMIFTLGAMAL